MNYFEIKNLYGSFWSLYICGINSIFDLKITLLQMCCDIFVKFISAYYLNKFIIEKNESKSVITNLIIFSFGLTSFFSFINNKFLEKKTLKERLNICKNIGYFVDTNFKNAPQTWKDKNSNSSQKEALRTIYFTYDTLTFRLIECINLFISGFNILFVSAFYDIRIFFITFLLNCGIIYMRNYLSFSLDEIDKKLGDISKKADLFVMNQFANRVDTLYNHNFKDILEPNDYNPIDGLEKMNLIWDERHHKFSDINMKIDITKNILIGLISYYFIKLNLYECIIFIFINKNDMFAFSSVYSKFEEVKNLSQGRLSIYFKMIDDLDCSNTNSVNILVDMNEDIKIQHPNKISLKNINKKITDNIFLKYNGIIDIDLKTPGIILLDGQKGCGKSVTMDILAGFYDNYVTEYMYIDKCRIPNEFRSLYKNRVYIRQTIADDYRSNKSNTITMNLRELFPNSSYDEIKIFLSDFNILNKIPEDMVTPISKDERGLSPGELQTFILASQIWKFVQMNVPLLLCDEPERNIDFETVKKIFRKINQIMIEKKCTIILITHSDLLKNYIQPMIKQIWKYHPNENGELGFTLVNI